MKWNNETENNKKTKEKKVNNKNDNHSKIRS